MTATEAPTYGPALGLEQVVIIAPGRACHRMLGRVVYLHLASNEATVQVRGGIQYIVPWDALEGRGLLGTSVPHGSRVRYRQGCQCHECTAANATYIREYRAQKKRLHLARQRAATMNIDDAMVARDRAAYELDQELDGKAAARADDGTEPCS